MRWVLFDELVARAAQDEAELRQAREEWSQATGKVHPEHELYAERSDAFVEWFVLERRAPADGLTWVERELVRSQLPEPGPEPRPEPQAEPRSELRSEPQAESRAQSQGVPGAETDRATYRALRAAHRSLFRVCEVLTPTASTPRGSLPPAELAPDAPDDLLLEDLLGGALFRVAEARLPFVQVGDLFEARIVPDPAAPQRLLLGRAVLFHPRDAALAVQEHVSRAQRRGEPRPVLLARLLRLRLRALSYKHVKPQRIYSQPDALP